MEGSVGRDEGGGGGGGKRDEYNGSDAECDVNTGKRGDAGRRTQNVPCPDLDSAKLKPTGKSRAFEGVDRARNGAAPYKSSSSERFRTAGDGDGGETT